MDSGIISGLIGGIVAVLIGKLVSQRAKQKITDGRLQHGVFILLLAIACAAIAMIATAALLFDKHVSEKSSELFSVIGLMAGFGIAALACFAEYFKVEGHFDNDGIEFRTPWTGYKKEHWDDLASARFNASMSWYTLTFRSGKSVRLSTFLAGHGEVLSLLKHRGVTISGLR